MPCFFSGTNTMWPSGNLSCTNFDHVWNNWRELASKSVHPWDISEFLRRVLQALKTAHGSSILDGVLVTSVQLVWQKESFLGLVDIPRMCLLYVSFGGECTIWAHNPPNKGHSVVNTTPFSITSASRKILCKSGSWITTISTWYVAEILKCKCVDIKVRVTC